MNYGRINHLTNLVSRVVLGCGELCSIDQFGKQDPKKLADKFSLLDAAIEFGCNAFDTAAAYFGSEQTLGLWINSRKNRESITVISKGGLPDLRTGEMRLTSRDLAADLDQSLSRLNTEYIDLYCLHRDSSSLQFEELFEALDRFKTAGKIRAYGASNWRFERIEAANQYCRSIGIEGFVVSSPQYSLIDWNAPPWPGCESISGPGQKEERELYRHTEIPLLVWSPLANGVLSGKTPRAASLQVFASSRNDAIIKIAEEMANLHQVSLAQISLAYLFSQGLDLYAITGCSSIEHLRDCVGANALQLSADEISRLNQTALKG